MTSVATGKGYSVTIKTVMKNLSFLLVCGVFYGLGFNRPAQQKKLFNILSVRKSNRIYSRQEKDAAHMVGMHGFQPGRTYTRLLSKKL